MNKCMEMNIEIQRLCKIVGAGIVPITIPSTGAAPEIFY